MSYYDGNGNIIEIGGGSAVYDGDALPQYDALVSIKEREQINGYIRTNSNGGYWDFINSTYKFVVIPVNGGELITAVGNGASGSKVGVLKEYTKPTVSGTRLTFATGYTDAVGVTNIDGKTLPSDAKYITIQTVNNGNDVAPLSFMVDGREYAMSVRDEVNKHHYGHGVNWVQFGDSITAGYYSYFKSDGKADSFASGSKIVYPKLVADMNGWGYTNMGVGGMGWLETSVVGNYNSVAFNQIKKITDWSDINLVTFAYGINDYKADDRNVLGSLSDAYTYSESMTPSTVVESMRYCFDYIMSKKPDMKIIVFTPLNARGYNYNFGNGGTCWARGYAHPTTGITLDAFADLMMSVCDEYGIEVIDMTRFSCINKANIAQMLPDGVHPSVECHALLAREVSKKINFN